MEVYSPVKKNQGEEEAFLREAACSLSPGQTSNTLICPRCNGGQHRDRAFSLSRFTGGIAFICHRASCGFRGRRLFIGDDTLPDKRQKPKDRRYTGTLNFLPEEVSNELQQRYGLGAEYLYERGVRWAPDEQRVYIPTPYFNEDGGGILRSLNKNAQPKAKSCQAPGTSGMGFYQRSSLWENHADACEYVLVVEDAISALCAAPYVDTVSLQGTYMSHERLLELVEFAEERPIVFALDKDATDKAVGFVNSFKHLADVAMIALPKDIKDMTREEREEILWNFKY